MAFCFISFIIDTNSTFFVCYSGKKWKCDVITLSPVELLRLTNNKFPSISLKHTLESAKMCCTIDKTPDFTVLLLLRRCRGSIQGFVGSLSLHFHHIQSDITPPHPYMTGATHVFSSRGWEGSGGQGRTHLLSLIPHMMRRRVHFNKKKKIYINCPPWWKMKFIQFGSPHDASVRTCEWASVPAWNQICSVWVSDCRSLRICHIYIYVCV